MSKTRVRFCLALSSLASARRLRVLNLRDAGGFFDDGAAVLRLGAENLADAALLDDGVAFRPEAGAHEDVLNVAQAGRAAVDQVFAFAGTEQAASDGDFALFGGRASVPQLFPLTAVVWQQALRQLRRKRQRFRFPDRQRRLTFLSVCALPSLASALFADSREATTASDAGACPF